MSKLQSLVERMRPLQEEFNRVQFGIDPVSIRDNNSWTTTELLTASEVVEKYGNALTEKQLKMFQEHTGQIPIDKLEEITEEELKLIGFYKSESDSPFNREMYFSRQKSVIYRKRLVWSDDGVTGEETDAIEVHSFTYNHAIKQIQDNRDNIVRYGYKIQSIYDILDFMNGKEFNHFDPYIPAGFGLYNQLQNGNRNTYEPGRFDTNLLRNVFADNFGYELYQEPRRRVNIQTGSAGMEEFNRAMREDFERNRENLFTQRELTETPMLNLNDIQPIAIPNDEEMREIINRVRNERFEWDSHSPFAFPVITGSIPDEDIVTLQQIQNLNG